MADPVHVFLGVTGEVDAYRLLALTPGQRHPTAIQRALESQLARVDRHPLANTPQAEAVRDRLRAPADALRAGTPFVSATKQPVAQQPARQPSPQAAPQAAPQPAPAVPSQVRAPSARAVPINQHGLGLTAFDRTVLAVLIAYGGWNARSRAKLVATAAAHNVSPNGLMKVIAGLSGYTRRGGPHLDVNMITQGAARFEAPASPAPATTGADRDRWAEQLIPEIKHGGRWATIKLSLLFGAITVLLGVFFIRILTNEPSRQAPVRQDTVVTDGTPAVPPGPTADPVTPGGTRTTQPDTRSDQLAFASYPTFHADTSPDAADEAVDRSPRVPELFEQLARKLSVSNTASAASLQDWRVLNEQVGISWVLANDTILRAIRVAFIDVIRAASDRPSLTDDLLESLEAAVTRVRDPLDVWRGAWAAGMLGELATRTDIPPVVRDQAMRRLRPHLGEFDRNQTGFDSAARGWLTAISADLVDNALAPGVGEQVWELWIRAQIELGRGSSFEQSVLAAIGHLALSQRDIAAPGPPAVVLGRLLSLIDLEHSAAARRAVLDLLENDNVTTRDCWGLSSMLALSPGAPWFDDQLVIPFHADPELRAAAVAAISSRWPAAEVGNEARTGRGLAVNARLGAQWLRHATVFVVESRQANLERDPQVLLQWMVRASWLNEAAAALAGQDVATAQDALERFEQGWSWTPKAAVGWSRGGSLRPPQAPGGRGSGGPTPAGPGQGISGGNGGGAVFRNDGEWAEAFENARRSSEDRQDLLRRLRTVSTPDLGPIDAAVLVTAAYRSPTPEVRDLAQSIVLELFSRAPNVSLELLDQFVDAPVREGTSSFLESVTGRLLPGVRDPGWRADARVALLSHVVDIFPHAGDEIDALAAALNSSFLRRLQLQEPALAGAAARASPHRTIDMLVNAWRDSAADLVVTAPILRSLPEIERQQTTRNSLAHDPIQRTVSGQIALLDYLAFTVAAEQPSRAQEVADLVDELAVARATSSHVLQQSAIAETGAIRLWLIRIDPDRFAQVPRGREIGRADALIAQAFGALVLSPASIAIGARFADEDWNRRLQQLTPADPEAYFLLAEEMADAAQTPAERDRARELFRLAAVLDPVRFGRSSALALADLEDSDTEQRRLLALASLLDGRVGEPNWSPGVTAGTVDRSGGLELSQVLSVYRRGFGARAANMLNASEDAARLLAQYGDAIGGERRIRENMERYRTGELAPVKTETELSEMLRFERALLTGGTEEWSGVLLLHRGRPIVEIDPSDLGASFRADATRPYFRNGRWTAEPDSD